MFYVLMVNSHLTVMDPDDRQGLIARSAVRKKKVTYDWTVVCCWLLVVGCLLFVVCCWLLLVVGCGLWAVGCWLLAVGCWR